MNSWSRASAASRSFRAASRSLRAGSAAGLAGEQFRPARTPPGLRPVFPAPGTAPLAPGPAPDRWPLLPAVPSGRGTTQPPPPPTRAIQNRIRPATASADRFRRANLRKPIPRRRRARLHRLVRQVALDVAARSRWPSRTAGRGPSPAPSSRSSPARRAPAGDSFAGSVAPDRGRCDGSLARWCSAGCSAAAAPPRGSAAASPERRLLRAACGRAASCRSAARRAARPGA